MNSVAILTDPLTSGKKRNADEMMNLEEMDQKKVRLEDQAQVSKVVHIRHIPKDATEIELLSLANPFGKVSHILHMKNKQQALLELVDEETAGKMVNYYTLVAPTIRGNPVFVQFSQHKELKVTTPSQALMMESQDTAGKKILHVTVEHLLYPVTVSVLHQIFKTYGMVCKIVTFTRNGQFQALVQFQYPNNAETARKALDGQNIYNGCNTLRITFSKLTNLNVKYNNEKSRDYTKDLPSSEDVTTDPSLSLHNLEFFFKNHPYVEHVATRLLPGGVQLGHLQIKGATGVLPLPFGGSPLPAILSSTGVIQPQALAAAGLPGLTMNNLPLAAAHLMKPQGSVLLVSNLDEEKVTCDDLFILFGHYGDVQRVKILYNKKDSALIQMQDGQQAQTAQSNLNGIKLHGKEIRVSKSKHQTVTMPKGDEEHDKELTKDYANSSLHRFKRPGSKNFQNIFAPICTLHLSNIPETTSEEDLQHLFSTHGGTVVNFRFFPKDRKMALIRMSSVEEAIIALIKFHNFKLTESNHLRVSFAKNEM